PDGPARAFRADLRRGPALVGAVVPLEQVVGELDALAEACESRRFEGPPLRAGQDERERLPREDVADPPGRRAPGGCQRQIRSTGVPALPRPRRLAVADDPEPRLLHPRSVVSPGSPRSAPRLP